MSPNFYITLFIIAYLTTSSFTHIICGTIKLLKLALLVPSLPVMFLFSLVWIFILFISLSLPLSLSLSLSISLSLSLSLYFYFFSHWLFSNFAQWHACQWYIYILDSICDLPLVKETLHIQIFGTILENCMIFILGLSNCETTVLGE